MNPNDPEGEGCNALNPATNQPHGAIHYTADGVYIREINVDDAGTLIPQHSHVYPHTTMLVKGSIRVWEDGKLIGDRVAPTGIFIKAGVKHSFLTLENNTILYCIHNVSRTGDVEVKEGHHIFKRNPPYAI